MGRFRANNPSQAAADAEAYGRNILIQHYPSPFRQAGKAVFLGGAGGFSGARFWRFEGSHGPLCLRRWPVEGPSAERLAFIHSVLFHVAAAGFRMIPLPIRTTAGATFLESDGHLWELTPWLPGKADFRDRPSEPRLCAALLALARFHGCAAGHPSAPRSAGQSAGLRHRCQKLQMLRAGGLDGLMRICLRSPVDQIQPTAISILNLASRIVPVLSNELDAVVDVTLPLQPAIRDIWHAHLLFEDDQVSGLIDFGSLKVDTVCGDIARLLGSMVGNDPRQWQLGLDAYQRVRPLSALEQSVVGVFDRSSLLLSGINWLEWLYEQNRQFDDRSAVLARLCEIESRLRHLADDVL
jgi:homoserine kinase type II